MASGPGFSWVIWLVAVGLAILFMASAVPVSSSSPTNSGPTAGSLVRPLAGVGSVRGPPHATPSALDSDPPPLAPGADYATYLGNIGRTSNSTGEQLINRSDVASLRILWRFNPPAHMLNVSAAPEPISVDGVVYEGSWSGYEYAYYATNGTMIWKTYLGRIAATYGGITSTATFDNGTLVVGGGNSTLFALNASTGKILWSTFVGTPGQNYYIWTSPLILGKYVYLGSDSFFDSPNVASGLNQYYLSNGTLIRTFNTSVPYAIGSGIWSSPSYANGTIFITTGNPPDGSPGATAGNYSEAVVALKASDLAFEAKWQVPRDQRSVDGDFGASPTTFTVYTPHGPLGMVAAANKNGILYAWYQSNLTLAWDLRVAQLPVTKGTVNDTHISAAWNGQYLFDIAPMATINGAYYNGSVRALNPLTGAVIWQVALPQAWSTLMYAAPTCFNGLVLVPDDHVLYVLNATDGKLLLKFNAGNTIMAAVSVARGELYMGLTGGTVLALDLRLTSTDSDTLVAGTTSTYQLSAIGSGGLPDTTLGAYNVTWRFSAGDFAYGPETEHCFAKSGSAKVKASVRDISGTYSNQTLSITVASGAGCPSETRETALSTGSAGIAAPIGLPVQSVTSLSRLGTGPKPGPLRRLF